MSANSPVLTHNPQASFGEFSAIAFWITILALLPAAVLFGGMAALMIALAIGLAVMVWLQPAEAPGAGMLYLFACNVVFPSSARFDGIATSSEQLYWALGLLIITSAAVGRIGIRRVLSIPYTFRIFLVVALVAAAYGQTHGAAASYVIRQFYGILLLILYVGISLHVGSVSLLLRRIRTFGVFCALLFCIYFLAEFPTLGFHREQTTMGSQAAMMAIILFVSGFEHKKKAWLIGVFALMLGPMLIFQRRDELTFLMALPLTLAITCKSKLLKFMCYVAASLLLLPGIFPNVAQTAADFVLEKVPYVGNLLPGGSQDPDTLIERTLQLAAAVSTLQTQPWLGAGIGGNIGWDSPVDGYVEGAYVDNGWAYLLQKMGLIGAFAFLCLLATVIRSMSRESLAFSICLIAVLLMTMFSEPVFFHFTTAPFAGTITGLLLQTKLPTQRRGLSISPSRAG